MSKIKNVVEISSIRLIYNQSHLKVLTAGMGVSSPSVYLLLYIG
jgi:hypothetical protein